MKEKLSILKQNYIYRLLFCMMSTQFNFAQCTVPPSISYQGVASTYATGTPITPLLPTISGDALNNPTAINTITTLANLVNVPRGVAVDNNGTVFVATGNDILKIVGTNITTVGSGFNIPYGVAVDNNGAIYVTDHYNSAVKKIVGSTVTTLLSNINNPTGIAVGNDGAVYVTEIWTGTLKKILNGVVTTIATGLVQPMGVAVDANGVLYVASKYYNNIRKIDGTTITTLPGTYNRPWGVALDNAGAIYIGDTSNSVVKKIVGNIVSSIATGNSYPNGVAVDANGAIYFANEQLGSSNVKKIVIKTYSISPNLPTGMNFDIFTGIISGTPTVDTVATTYNITTQNSCGTSNTTITFATCAAPITTNITVTESSDLSNDKIVYPGTPVTLSASNGSTYLWNTGLTSQTITVHPTSTTTYTVTATSATGCKDVKSETITVIPNTSTPAPTGILEQIYAGTGTLMDVTLNGTLIKWYTTPSGNIVLDPSTIITNGTTYFASQTINGIESSLRLGVTMRKMSESNQALCKNVTVGNLITTPHFGSANWFATSTGGSALPNNTVLTSGNYYVERNIPEFTSYTLGNGFYSPSGIIEQADGKILICDTSNNAIKRMSPDGTNIETLGSGFNIPTGVAVESNGKILVVDKFNHAIKRMNTNGTNIESLGWGFYYPHAVAVQTDGKIVIADCFNNLIKRMDPDGSNIVTLGSGFNRPSGIAIQSDGKIVIADSNNNLIKRMNTDGTNIETLGSGFSYPVGIFIQNDGKILVADSYSNSIKRMNSDGTNIVTLGSGFLSPYGVLQQSDGTILVADSNRSLIKKLLNASTSNRVAVNVSVTPLPNAQDTQLFCNGGTVADLVATGTGTINWYNSATANIALLPSSILSTGTYYVSQTVNSCESAKKSVTIVIPNNAVIITGNSLKAIQNGASYQWYKCPNQLLAGETNQNLNVTETGEYKVEITIPGCSTIFTSSCNYASSENYFVKIATNPEIARGEFGTTTSTTTNTHRLGIKSNGTLWASGFNKFGQLGDGTYTDSFLPIQVGTRTDWVDAAVGWNFSLGITADGKLWSWGTNFYRALGDPTVLIKNKPEQVGNATNWVSVSAGRTNAFGITSDGKLWGWGQGTIGSNESYTYFPVQIGTASNWVYVECGTSSTFSISSDGKLWSWGNGYLGNGSPQGNTITLTPTQVGTATNWATISCGATHNLALTSDGKLWAWGDNSAGELGDNSTINKLVPTQVGTSTNWAAVSAGYWASSAIDNEGKLWTWGYDGCYFTGTNYILSPTLNHGNETNWESTNANASSYWNIKSDGSSVAFGAPSTCGYLVDNSSETFYTCSPTLVSNAPNFSNLANSGSSATMYQNSYNIYNNNDALIAAVSQRVASLYPIKGTTTAKVWVETNQPQDFVKRHYEIMPTTNAANATGKITLYFTQNEFDDFNLANGNLLPTNASDIAGIERLTITKLSGFSNDNSGLPSSYSGTSELINPVDSDIVWDATQNRWEVSFITTGFGGFFTGASQTKINLKLFLEGYYDLNTHAMIPVKSNQGVGISTTYVDDITVELRNTITGILVESVSAQLQTNGSALATFPATVNGVYYIVIKHRNSIQTWSASPQIINPSAVLNYDFSNSSSKVFGNNTKEIETGVFAIFTGDVNQDDIIDPSDYSLWEIDSDSFSTGYIPTDFNGDGVVDPSDYSIWESNSDSFIVAAYPTF